MQIFVTVFGRAIHGSQRFLGTGVKNYWKLKAIDSLGVAYDTNMLSILCQ
jgi:hypothetical protein